MNKQELIKKYKRLEGVWDASGAETARQIFLQDLDQLDETEKVKVPKFVANWIANVKRNGFKFRNSSRFYEEIVSSDDAYRVMFYILKESIAGEAIRIWVNANRDTFARAWLDGYEVEKEKRYSVKIRGEISENLLVYGLGINRYFFARTYDSTKRNEHTRKQLEKAGFGWVFDCEGIEIKEV